jgi:hypothetical protein
VAAETWPEGEPGMAWERWRDAAAELEYAERHGAPAADVERLAGEVFEARVALFQSAVNGGRELPEFAREALERDRALLEIWPEP